MTVGYSPLIARFHAVRLALTGRSVCVIVAEDVGKTTISTAGRNSLYDAATILLGIQSSYERYQEMLREAGVDGGFIRDVESILSYVNGDKELQMAQTEEGRKKQSHTMLTKYTAEERAEWGRRGGSTPTTKPKGLAALSPERRKEIQDLATKAKREKKAGMQ